MGVLGIFVGIEKPQPVHFARSTGHCYCCHCRGFVSFINLDSGHGDDIGTGEENNTGVSQPSVPAPRSTKRGYRRKANHSKTEKRPTAVDYTVVNEDNVAALHRHQQGVEHVGTESGGALLIRVAQYEALRHTNLPSILLRRPRDLHQVVYGWRGQRSLSVGMHRRSLSMGCKVVRGWRFVRTTWRSIREH